MIPPLDWTLSPLSHNKANSYRVVTLVVRLFCHVYKTEINFIIRPAFPLDSDQDIPRKDRRKRGSQVQVCDISLYWLIPLCIPRVHTG